MKHLKKILAIVLVVMSVMAITVPSLAAEMTVSDGGTNKYLFDISGRSTAPTFSIRPINTDPLHTATVKLNYNDLTVSPTYFKFSNSMGLSGSMTEKTLTESSNFRFVQGRSDRAQIQLVSNYGSFTIRFFMN